MESIYVFLVFHKKGKYQVKEFDGEDELETFLIKYLKKYKRYRIPPPSLSLYDLIHECLKVGSIVLDERAGYGIVKVVSGSEFQDSCTSEEEEYIESNESGSDNETEENENEEEVEKDNEEENEDENENEEDNDEESEEESEEEENSE